jgi:NAD(P)H-dependent FMN reductase
MNLLIISASQRINSQSNKVAQYLAEVIIGFSTVNHIELCRKNLPLWDGEQSSKASEKSDWSSINEQIKVADALILITPEWDGTASPLLKNFLMMCEGQDTAHKPALLTSVSNGISGAYPIAELRMSAFKNNKLVAIPDHLIIRNVEQVLNTPEQGEQTLTTRDNSTRQRIAYSLHTLKHYAQAQKILRASLAKQPFSNEQDYAYGM